MKQKYVIGIDIGGTRTKIGLTDPERGTVLTSSVLPTQKHQEDLFYQDIRDTTEGQLKACGIDPVCIAGAGAAIGSYVDTSEGIVDTMCGFIDYMEHYPLGRKLSGLFSRPVRVENDARCICYGESRYGAGKNFERVLLLTLGTGVGVGFTVGGRLPDRDASIHLAGHIMVRGRSEDLSCLDQPGCYCKIKGCLESTCSGTALNRLAKAAGAEDGPGLMEEARKGSGKAASCLDWYLGMLLRGLNQYVYLFAPDIILLGGGVANGLEPWLPVLNKGLAARVHSGSSPRIALAVLKEEGGILGAASLFWEEAGKEASNENYKRGGA